MRRARTFARACVLRVVAMGATGALTVSSHAAPGAAAAPATAATVPSTPAPAAPATPAAAPAATAAATPAEPLEAIVRRLIEAQLPRGLTLVSVTLPKTMATEAAVAGAVTVVLPRSLAPGRISAKVTRPVGRSARSAQVPCVLASVGPVIVVRRALGEGELVAEADLAIEQLALPSGAAPMTATVVEATRRRLIGATLRHALAERAALTEADVAPAPPIASGAAVEFELRRGGLVVRGSGTLERAARIGEQVLVRLSAAQAPLRGTLVSATAVVLEAAS